MKRFSTIDFEGELYVLPGKADQYALLENEALKDKLMEYDTSEKVIVYVDIYYLNDGVPELSGDLLAGPELDDITNNFVTYLNDDMFLLQESYRYEVPGALPVPFEDYYNLTGADREAYISSKKAMLEEREEIINNFKAKGFSDDEIEQWFRYEYWGQSSELEGE